MRISDEVAISAMVGQLERIAQEQRLIERAQDSLRESWVPEDLGDLAFGYEDVVALFTSCQLTFKTGAFETGVRVASHPFVSTSLDLRVGRYHVGYYKLITLPNGETEDDYLVIYDEFAEGGRLVRDVRREVRRLRAERMTGTASTARPS